MKKTVFALFGLVVLSGCAGYYDYYKGGVRYTQDGEDCVFYAAERGRRYSEDIRSLNTDKKIVYRNTACRDLYLRDNMWQTPRTERQTLTPVNTSECGCAKKCGKKKYVFVK
ncbi:MAG: membrane lipoprotein lipid attachment site-containing protein [Alphaproteobacteria bacterium]|nr:membrane lipoprotein lipid attachment site-containing protein [Alphaproteobacteria bacterium]